MRRSYGTVTPVPPCRALPRCSGGSKTTLYNYFASKRDLFVAVTDRESGTLFDEIFVVAETTGDFRTTVVEFARRILTALLSEQHRRLVPLDRCRSGAASRRSGRRHTKWRYAAAVAF